MSRKITLVLHITSVFLLLILIRCWHLAVIQHDHHIAMSHKPQRRTRIEKATRATIEDRFGIPLAVNKIQYSATISYAQIRRIPAVRWQRNSKGIRVRIPERLNYISELSHMLSAELGLSATHIEDQIHAKASLLPHTPLVLQEDLSEEQYCRLKNLEREWIGLEVVETTRREYPLGKTAADVIGYLGKISSSSYLKIAHELKILEDYLLARRQGETPLLPEGFDSPEEAEARFFELQEKAYAINDLVGKSGLEAFYEEDLRGYMGKHIYEIDRKGRFLKELPGSYPAAPGKKLTLTLSAELQMFAEELLASNEGSRLDKADGGINEKWMRGSAAVALIPKTGEIVALASYPRFDPNDFIPAQDPEVRREKEFAVRQWLETEDYLGEIWDGKRPLKREYFSFAKGKYLEETAVLSWGLYLDAILPSKGPLRDLFSHINTVSTALQIQERGVHHSLLKEIAHDGDQALIFDLCRLVVPFDRFSPELIELIGEQTLESYFAIRQETMRLSSSIQEEIKTLFHDLDFTEWRKSSFKNYLLQMRAKEKAEKRYPRPYTDYLYSAHRKLWGRFWEAYRSIFLYVSLTGHIPIVIEDYPHLAPYLSVLKETYFPALQSRHLDIRNYFNSMPAPLAIAYLKTFRGFEELTLPLTNKYPKVRSSHGASQEKHLAMAFYPPYGYGFIRSQTYRVASPPGSVFKLVTTYQTLAEQYEKGELFNPLTMTDDWRGSPGTKRFILGYLADGTPLYRGYKGGRLPRSSHPGMGKLDLYGALEQSSNVYFSLLAGDVIADPSNLAHAARLFRFGEKTGIDLPGESRGNVPDDLDRNRTGLYAFAIGQHTLEATPLQTALMTSIIANHGKVIRPRLVQRMEGVDRTLHHHLLEEPSADCSLSETTVHRETPFAYTSSPIIDQEIPLPSPIFNALFRGMQQVVLGRRGTARPAVMRALYDHPTSVRDYLDIHQDLICKTGTAQVLYQQSIFPSASPVMRHYISFTAIVYPTTSILLPPVEKEPELVVTISLRYRQAGLEGGPIVAQIVKKWREIKKRYGEL